MIPKKIPKAMIDSSVIRNAVVGQWGMFRHEIKWGTQVVKTDVVMMQRRPLPPVDQVERAAQIYALPTIRRLVMGKKLRFATSQELNFESWSGRGGAGDLGDLFHGLEYEDCPPAVERSFFVSAPIGEYLEREAMRSFCRFLLSLDENAVEQFVELLPDLPLSTASGLRDISRFKALAAGAPDKHLPDIFHLWTAERAGCDFFLTMDEKFINFILHGNRHMLPCVPILPLGLLSTLGIEYLYDMPWKDYELIDFFSAIDRHSFRRPSGIEDRP